MAIKRKDLLEHHVYLQQLRAHQALQGVQWNPEDPDGQQEQHLNTNILCYLYNNMMHNKRLNEGAVRHNSHVIDKRTLTEEPGGPGTPRAPIGPCLKVRKNTFKSS